ncbi:hypothetical protein EYF80_042119 [Liparis tanakae]|uniref:Uncharacterized protein n=1 Tax=Liparis tanakae TaxID=230148 RepID=A0A4Z2G290_9TELE|nr:hypothetical protein EYF80_042119 [Liparis tanakae]
MLPCEQAQYSTTPQMAPRKTPSADMAMMVMRMGSRVFSMLPGPPSSLVSSEYHISQLQKLDRSSPLTWYGTPACGRRTRPSRHRRPSWPLTIHRI